MSLHNGLAEATKYPTLKTLIDFLCANPEEMEPRNPDDLRILGLESETDSMTISLMIGPTDVVPTIQSTLAIAKECLELRQYLESLGPGKEANKWHVANSTPLAASFVEALEKFEFFRNPEQNN